MKIKSRKMLFLSTTISRGTQPRKDAGDGIEVGPGFATAAERMGSDDTRAVPEKPVHIDLDAAGEADGDGNSAGADEDAGTGDDEGAGDGDGADGTDTDAEPDAPKKRATSQYIKDLKRELREEKLKNSTFEQRLTQIENSGLPSKNSTDNSSDTSGAPDPNDASKYPLGVLDDRYIEDKIEWVADKKVAKTFDGIAQTGKAQAEQASVDAHMDSLREKMFELTDKGSELFDDFEDVVLKGGLSGTYLLSETTFTAAGEATNGPAILHALAHDKAEAKRVHAMTPFQQLKYVADKDAALSAKTQPRLKPKAGDPPQNLPRGRNSSSPLRPDTDDLNDFRKQFYAKR